MKLPSEIKTTFAEKEWFVQWVRHHFLAACVKRSRFRYFTTAVVAGGTGLITFLLVRKAFKSLKDARTNTSWQKLFEHVETTKRECRNLRAELEETITELQAKISKLENEKHNMQKYHENEKVKIRNQLEEIRQLLSHSRQEHQSEEEKANDVSELQQLLQEVQRLLHQVGIDNTVADLHQNAESAEKEDPYVTETLTKIEEIHEYSKELKNEIQAFSGREEDTAYLHLKEMLIRNTIKLDALESEGYAIIRNKKKEAIQYIHKCLDVLSRKAKS